MPARLAAARVFVDDAAGRVELAARTRPRRHGDGGHLRTLLAALRRLLKTAPVNTVALRRQIADAVVARRAILFDGACRSRSRVRCDPVRLEPMRR